MNLYRLTKIVLQLFCTMALLLSSSKKTLAQSNIRDSAIALHIASIYYELQMPGGDLKDRFGGSSMVGASYSYKFKNNLMLSLNGGFLFGNTVKEDSLFRNISNEDGNVIGNDGRYADIRLYERGYHVSLTFGKLFSFKKPNPNSGILLSAGPGFMQHKIRIETIGNTVPQLDKEYRKGYDRLSNGIEMYESITYYYFGNRYLVNFYLGVDFIQGFTQNRRLYNFDNMNEDKTKRIDLLFGIKAGWMLPIYKKAPNKYYYH